MFVLIILSDLEIFYKVRERSSFTFSRTPRALGKLYKHGYTFFWWVRLKIWFDRCVISIIFHQSSIGFSVYLPLFRTIISNHFSWQLNEWFVFLNLRLQHRYVLYLRDHLHLPFPLHRSSLHSILLWLRIQPIRLLWMEKGLLSYFFVFGFLEGEVLFFKRLRCELGKNDEDLFATACFEL